MAQHPGQLLRSAMAMLDAGAARDYLRLACDLPERVGEDGPMLDDDRARRDRLHLRQHRPPAGRIRRPGQLPHAAPRRTSPRSPTCGRAGTRRRTSSPPCRRSTCTAWRCRCCCRCSGPSPCMRRAVLPRRRRAGAARCARAAHPGDHARAPARAARDPGARCRRCARSFRRPRRCRAELAAAAEARFGCEVREVFGSTETCVIARRRTARETAWTPLPGVRAASAARRHRCARAAPRPAGRARRPGRSCSPTAASTCAAATPTCSKSPASAHRSAT